MSQKMKLLPPEGDLASWLRRLGVAYTATQSEIIEGWIQDYALANVEHHAEKLQAEIEALKQDLDQYRDAALKEHEHAERLEAALRHMVSEAIDGGHSYMLKAIKDSGASTLLRDQGEGG